MKTHMVKTAIVSMVLALLLKIGFHVPFLTSFIAIFTIYVVHVLKEQVGGGIKTIWDWLMKMRDLVVGVVVFLVIRYLAAMVLGIFPIDTYNALDSAGGLYGILPSHNVPTVLAFEVVFALVAGQLVLMWANGTHKMPVRLIMLGSLVILVLHAGVPKYTATWPSRDVVSTNFENIGIGGTALKALKRVVVGKLWESKPTTPPAVLAATAIVEEFPISGEGQATKEIGLRAWLNPMSTYVRATAPVRYVLVENPQVSFEDSGPIGQNKEKWFEMPSGKYLVYPLEGDKIYFRWSQTKID